MFGLFDSLAEKRRKAQLQCPGSYENLHREVKATLPTLHMFDGAKVDLMSVLTPNFQIMHSFTFAAQQYPPTYHLGAWYSGSKGMMHGQVDSEGSVSGRANLSWFSTPAPPAPSQDPNLPPTPTAPSNRPQATSKAQFQLAADGSQSMLQLEHEHVGSDYSLSLKAINPNPFDSAPRYADDASETKTKSSTSTTGIFIAQYLQSITSSLALGAELVYQRPTPEIEEPSLSFVSKWAPRPTSPLQDPPSKPPSIPSPYQPSNPFDPQQCLTTVWSPANGLLHSSYWRKVNTRLELAAETQLLIVPGNERMEGRREGVATVGFKLDTLLATVRGSVDTAGKVSMVLEERLAAGLSFQIAGEMDYSRPQGGLGKVGVGFTLEA